MNIFSAENILAVCETIAIFAGVLAVAALIGQVFANRHISRQHTERMLELETNVSEQQIRAAEAETRLIELRERVNWRVLPSAFRETLISRPKGSAEIVYQPDDDEAYMFADSIWHSLQAAGWIVPEHPQTSLSIDPEAKSSIPFMMREAGISTSNWHSVIVLTSGVLVEKPYQGDTPLDSLMFAFESTGYPAFLISPHESLKPSAGVIRIVIGSRL